MGSFKKRKVASVIEQDIKELELFDSIVKTKRVSKDEFYQRGNQFNNHPTHGYGDKRLEYDSDWRGYPIPKTSTNKAKVKVSTQPVKNVKFSDLEINAIVTAVDAINLLIKKHNDYGPKNISDAPGGPLTGLAVRLHDKVARLSNLVTNNKKPSNESLEDTFVDILNYAVIGLLVLKDKWDK
jgi:hypothetical protein